MLNFKEDQIKLFNLDDVFKATRKSYLNILRSLRRICKEEGIFSLYRGMHYEVIKVGINGALFYVTLEFLNNMFKI